MKMKADCAKCHKRRTLKIITGPGLHPKGVEMCRTCAKAYKLAIELKAEFDVAKAVR